MSNYEEINNLDPEDIGLKEVMGNQFQDATQQTAQPKRARGNTKSTYTAYQVAKEAVQKANEKAMDAQWEPVKQRNWMDDLKDCMKSSLIFGGLNMLIWYWQISGLMDESVALPSMLICAALFGIGLGKCCKRGKG